MVSSCLRKEGRNKDIGVAKEMGWGVGPGGGVGNSLICSAICSSGPICTTSIRAGGVGVRMSRDALSSSSNSLTTSPTMDSTNTSLTSAEVPTGCVLGESWVSAAVLVLRGLPSLGSARKVPVDPVLLGSRLYHPSFNLLGSKSHLRCPEGSPPLREVLLVVIRRRGSSSRPGSLPSYL